MVTFENSILKAKKYGMTVFPNRPFRFGKGFASFAPCVSKKPSAECVVVFFGHYLGREKVRD